MAKKPKPKPTSPGQNIQVNTPAPSAAPLGSSQVYIGVDTGSDLETQGYQVPRTAEFGIRTLGTVAKLPLYKVGYLNSQNFAKELNNLDPNTIYMYQQRLNAIGLLDKFTPGQMDTATRNAFKKMIGQANQTATTWQQALHDSETVGVEGSGTSTRGSTRDPFVATLDDPITLKAAFRAAAQNIYGGDLPDEEINQMVDAYRAIQLQKEQQNYDIQATGGSMDSLPDPGTFAEQQIRDKHPDQVAKMEFNGTFTSALRSLAQTGGGM